MWMMIIHTLFLVCMTFTNNTEVRQALAKYVVAKGVDLKLKPNERLRIRV